MSRFQPFAKVLVQIALMLSLRSGLACGSVPEGASAPFEAVKIGDSEDLVVQTLGPPTLRERRATGVLPALPPCAGVCVVRLWYENCGFVDQAWSFEFDRHGVVTGKTIWNVPDIQHAAQPAKLAGASQAGVSIASESEPVNDF